MTETKQEAKPVPIYGSEAAAPVYFKILAEGRKACHGGDYTYPEPGVWTEPQPVDLCRSGYHLVKPRGLLDWLGETIWLSEGRGKSAADADGKSAFEQVRLLRQLPWDASTARLFACDCAERALERERDAGREPDKRSWEAIKVARAFASDEATQEDLNKAYSAACSAAYGAANSAANSAAYGAAYSAANSASYSAAYRAAYRAAYKVERVLQTRHLMENYLGVRLTEAPE